MHGERMNQEIKARWTTALRSGEYKQGTRALRKRLDDGSEQHCCLGVLCDLAVADGVLPAPELQSGEYIYQSTSEYEYDGTYPEAGILPVQVRKWAGLRDGNPDVDQDGGSSLATLNDHGYTFLQIADLIDSDL